MTTIPPQVNDLLQRLVDDNARLRAQNYKHRATLQRLLDPEDLGWAVSEEVRQLVKRIVSEA